MKKIILFLIATAILFTNSNAQSLTVSTGYTAQNLADCARSVAAGADIRGSVHVHCSRLLGLPCLWMDLDEAPSLSVPSILYRARIADVQWGHEKVQRVGR